MTVKNSVHGDTVFRFGTLLFGCAFFIGLCGVLTIYSAQSSNLDVHPLLLPGKQLLFLLAGLVIMALCCRIRFAWFVKWAWLLTVLSLAALTMVLFAGTSVHGMTGWFNVGALFIQPSELAKFVFALMLAKLYARVGSDWQKLLFGALFSVLWIGLILLQPDFGTAAIYFAMFTAGYILSGAKWRYLALLIPPALATLAIFCWRNAYAVARLLAYLDPASDPQGAGYHALQFKLAIARGGWFGEKLGRAMWSNVYLPLSYNDSAFATMAETLGLAGVLMLTALLAAMVGAMFVQGARLPSGAKTAKLYIGIAAFGIAFQALLHIGVNTAILPTTGLTLPLISYGGSSIFGSLAMLGVAVSASGVRRKDYEKFEN